MLVDPHLYQKAFQDYLTKGTPTEWSIKQERPMTHCIWRTRDDDKVRSSHAANDGKIFAWDDPPPTGYPGEDFGCRCTAEPYYSEVAEHLTTTLSDVSDSSSAWSSRDFVRHQYRGQGRGITVRETSHLRDIVDYYMNLAQTSLQKNITRKARENPNGSFSDDFGRSYGMTGISFPIGDTTIGGHFSGRSSDASGVLTISGGFEFYLYDEFADPADIGEAGRWLGIDDARDVEIIDLGETILENVHRPLEDYLRGRVVLLPASRQQHGIHTGEHMRFPMHGVGCLKAGYLPILARVNMADAQCSHSV